MIYSVTRITKFQNAKIKNGMFSYIQIGESCWDWTTELSLEKVVQDTEKNGISMVTCSNLECLLTVQNALLQLALKKRKN